MRFALALSLIASALMGGACRNAAPLPPPVISSTSGGVTSWRVPAAAPDPGTTGPSHPNLVLVGPRSGWNGYLFVLMAGPGGHFGCCESYLRQAAAEGFHVIGLAYDGTGPVPRVAARNTVAHRLIALLSYLNALYPRLGWTRYLPESSPTPIYSRIVVAGYGPGAERARLFARHYGARWAPVPPPG